MTQIVIKKRMEALAVTKVFSILFDETTDVAHLGEVMSFVTFFDMTMQLVTQYLTTRRLKIRRRHISQDGA
jgi:hypothetical protein